jgi:CheY-like chemotaxis protein
MNMVATRDLTLEHGFQGSVTAARQGVVAVVSDNPTTIDQLSAVCEFLDLKVAVVESAIALEHILQTQHPMAVMTDVDSREQDGFHVMKQVACYNRDLPILLLTAGDPVLMGAADAVQGLWGLTAVTNTSEFPTAGQLVQFLFTAGRNAGCMRLLPI